jgi:transcriptional regulator with XRE-family HTH domain
MANKSTNQIDLIIGKRIRFCRHNANMSQESLGRALGVTFQQIQKYELGTNRISASRLHEMATLFAVPVSYFFEGLHEAVRTDLPVPDGEIIGQALDKIRERSRRDFAMKLMLTLLREFEAD